jgi:quercetin dioxygenase-like cupin family protein
MVMITEGHRTTPDTLVILSPVEVDQLPWQPVPDCPGVRAKELWRGEDLVQALIVLEPGARIPGVPHLGAHHHIWVVSGEASIGGKRLGAGSYVYVPPGTAHPIVGLGAADCTLLQVHRPHRP